MITYDKFIAEATERGFISKYISEFVLVNLNKEMWWTGHETDPGTWAWRAVEERKLVYGTFFKGQKGFISPEWYGVYFHAFHPNKTVEQRYEAGLLPAAEWNVWQLLQREARPLGTHEIRSMLGVSPKNGANAIDTAITNLQMTCDIVIPCEVDMLDKNGKPHNKSVAYAIRADWIPDFCLNKYQNINKSEALEKIYQRVYEISDHKDMESVKAIFKKQLKLLKLSGGFSNAR